MAFEALKEQQSAMWGAGPYERVSEQLRHAHEHLLRVVEPREGERWLDVATGTGEISCRVAARGPEVTALDLAPNLIEAAKRRAEEAGVEVHFDVGDAEALPYEDASFDTVSSTFGVMFAPDQRAAAGELARVCKPGGRVGLCTWPQAGTIADFFGLLGPYQPAPPPEGAGNPLDWGDQGHVEALLGDAFELTFEVGDTPLHAESAEEVWQEYTSSFGPVKTLVESLDDDRREALHKDWLEYFGQFSDPDGGGLRWPRPYLLVSGRRR